MIALFAIGTGIWVAGGAAFLGGVIFSDAVGSGFITPGSSKILVNGNGESTRAIGGVFLAEHPKAPASLQMENVVFIDGTDAFNPALSTNGRGLQAADVPGSDLVPMQDYNSIQGTIAVTGAFDTCELCGLSSSK